MVQSGWKTQASAVSNLFAFFLTISSPDELIEAINTDIKLAREKMEDPDVSKQQNNSFFLGA
jgi:hypothetical protein